MASSVFVGFFERQRTHRDGDAMRPLYFIGSAHADLKSLPGKAQRDIGFALYEAQLGSKSSFAKPLKGFHGAGVLEIVENFDGDTFRAVYTVRFKQAVYVLHVFQKKSKRGIETPKSDMNLIGARLKVAELDAKAKE